MNGEIDRMTEKKYDESTVEPKPMQDTLIYVTMLNLPKGCPRYDRCVIAKYYTKNCVNDAGLCWWLK